MNNDKKVKYVKIGEEPITKEKKKKRSYSSSEKITVGKVILKTLGIIGTTVSAMVLVVVIAMCIVVTGLALYVTQFAETDFDVSLEDAELNSSSFIYGYDSEGNEVQIKQLSSDENRVLIKLDDLPKHVINAFISAEDARFLDHDGVDWKRTVAVTVRMVAFGGTEGGSTITQQLVRDITGDKEVSIGRKLREVFRALELEKKYSKTDILESYLNRIGFGGTSYGIASASAQYFDKTPDKLTVAEAAVLAGIIRSPSNYNPYSNLSKTREKQLRCLDNMYKYGYLTTAEYNNAVNEKVRFRLPVKGDDFGYVDERYNEYYGIQEDGELSDPYYENVSWEELGVTESEAYIPYTWDGDYEVNQNWYVDAAIKQIVNDLAELKGITPSAARTLFYKGGFKAYLNMDIELQDKLEEMFLDPSVALKVVPTEPVTDLPETVENEIEAYKKDLIQGAFIITNYSGTVLALVGGFGEKEGNDCFNRATMDPQTVGSTIKPLAVYSLALEDNLITYSSMLKDMSGKVPAGALGEDYEMGGYDPTDNTNRWPHNFEESGFGDYKYHPAWWAVQQSKNTMAVYTLSKVGLQTAFNHLTEKLHFDLDPVNDMSWAPLALGQFTNGVDLLSLTAAYAIMGNGGLYYRPYLYSKVVDKDGRIVLSQNVVGERVISADTAYITNRLMKSVIDNDYGNGSYARLPNIEVVGKTGTANDETTRSFVGLTPEYVVSYRICRDNHSKLPQYGDLWRQAPLVWGNVMRELTEGAPAQTFEKPDDVLEMAYCAKTGFLAGDKCKETLIGYYKKTNYPKVCDGDLDHDDEYFEKNYGVTEIPLYD